MRLRIGIIIAAAAALAAVLSLTLIFRAPEKKVSYKQIEQKTSAEIQHRLNAGGGKSVISGERLIMKKTVAGFYKNHSYSPAWAGSRGNFPAAMELLAAIRGTGAEGLDPKFYHQAAIKAALRAYRNENEKKSGKNPAAPAADLDILLTDAFLALASHLLEGRVDPETFDPEWNIDRRKSDLPAILEHALKSRRIAGSLKTLSPSHPIYQDLIAGLAQYRALAAAGGWNKVPERDKSLKPGETDPRVPPLRSRLAAEGYLSRDDIPKAQTPDETLLLYDKKTFHAMKNFQERNGLEPDGAIGHHSLAALNVSADDRLRQIELALERWRRLPRSLGTRYIIVNAADYTMDVVENGKSVLNMKVIVGTAYRRTPVFSAVMTRVVLAPYWHVSRMVAVEDKLPEIRKDPMYLIRHNMKLFQRKDGEFKEIDPGKVDWSKVTKNNFNFRIQQAPGPKNALGRVKFLLPNSYDVYLHDTPSRGLFSLAARSFSSGCIRIQKPIELADYLLHGDNGWTHEKILAAIEKGQEKNIKIPAPITVYLIYCTVLTNPDGSVGFREDIYDRDKALDEALKKL